MVKSNKHYQIIDLETRDVVYSCAFEPEAKRVFDLLRMIKPECSFSLNVVLMKA